MEIEKSTRYRVNVSISTKGQKTWDCTVDMEKSGEQFTSLPPDHHMQQVLAESDILVAELEKRYPPAIEGK